MCCSAHKPTASPAEGLVPVPLSRRLGGASDQDLEARTSKPCAAGPVTHGKEELPAESPADLNSVSTLGRQAPLGLLGVFPVSAMALMALGGRL